MSFDLFFTNLLYGLTIGSALILIASSLSIIFGVMGVINFAHGSLCMLGAYVGYTLILLKFNFWVALVISPLIVGGLALAIEGFTLRPLYGKDPLLQFILTYGLAMIIGNLVLYFWGADPHGIDKPISLQGPISLAGIAYPKFRMFVFVFSAVLAILLWFFIAPPAILFLIAWKNEKKPGLGKVK